PAPWAGAHHGNLCSRPIDSPVAIHVLCQPCSSRDSSRDRYTKFRRHTGYMPRRNAFFQQNLVKSSDNSTWFSDYLCRHVRRWTICSNNNCVLCRVHFIRDYSCREVFKGSRGTNPVDRNGDGDMW